MDNLEYLNQISVKPKVKPSKSFLPPINKKILFIISGILAAIILVAFLASILSSPSSPTEPSELSSLRSLYYRLSSIAEPLKAYTNKVKSPIIRSSGSTLYGILSNSKTDLSSLLSSEYGINTEELEPDETTLEEIETFTKTLENARLNGILDRTYTNELSHQISILLIYENSALEKTSNPKVKSFLETSTSSLETLKEDLSK